MTETIDLSRYVSRSSGNRILQGVTPALRRIAQSAPPGAVIEARGLKGTVLLEADPFEGITTADLELRSGEAVFQMDFNRGSITLPSRLTWRMEGTQIRPAKPINAIPTDASPAGAVISTAIYGGYCSVSHDRQTLNVDDASGLRIGGRIAIFGTKLDPSVAFRLSRRITAAEQGVLPLAGDISTTVSASRVYLMIDDEILLGTVTDGQLRITERGAVGSQAADHAAGTPAVLVRSSIATIADVKGKSVRLAEPLSRTAARTIFKAGAIDASLTGDGLIDGEYAGAAAGFYSALGSTLSTRFNCSGDIRLARAAHGGLMLFGATKANIHLQSVSGIGRRSEQLGASIWLFGETEDSAVTVERLEKGNLGIAIDNKSFGVSYFGLDGPGRNNHLEVGALVDHLAGVQISSGRDNRCQIGFLDTLRTDVIIDPGASQSTRPISARNNIVVIERQTQRRPDLVEPGNQVVRY